MPLVQLPTLLADAQYGGYALGYFEAWDSYSLEAIVQAAEAEEAPVILGFGCLLVDQSWLDNGGIETLGFLGRRTAEGARVPVSLLLNEAHTLEHALRGIDAGFNAVMLHTDDLDTVAKLVRHAHAHSVAVEGEIGVLPDAGPDGGIDLSHAHLTDPDEALAFLAATGVDCLAVSFGNVHTLEGASASVDLDRLSAINDRVDVPLVVHGGTGFPDEAIAEAITRGVAKFNVGTALKRGFLDALHAAVDETSAEASPHDLLGSHSPADLFTTGQKAVTQVVRKLIQRYGGSGHGHGHGHEK
jgi:fructose-bisphosphate aldolase class II